LALQKYGEEKAFFIPDTGEGGMEMLRQILRKLLALQTPKLQEYAHKKKEGDVAYPPFLLLQLSDLMLLLDFISGKPVRGAW